MSGLSRQQGAGDSVRGFLRSRAAERNANSGRWRVVALVFLAGVVCLPALRALTGSAKQTADASAAATQREGEGEAEAEGASVTGGTIDWENAPRIDLVCRTCGGGLHIMWNTFMPSYLLFWPIKAWKSSGLVFILDGDSPFDRQQGTVLENLALPSKLQIKYESPAPEGTLCSKWRGEGYSRQQYSNFYADLYSDDAEFVAIIDTDAAFRTPVIPSDLFEDGKPIVRGFNQASEWVSDVSTQAWGGDRGVGRFMTRYTFPLVLRSSDLPDVRAGIARNLGVPTFEEAFHKICDEGAGSYSQFEIMMNYLWYSNNDGYAWHIADPASGEFEEISGHSSRPRANEDEAVFAKNVPTILPMRHMGKAIDDASVGPSALFKNLCFGSGHQAGYCTSQEPSELDGKPITGLWSAADRTWQQTYEDHTRDVGSAHPAFDWRVAAQEDWVHPGQ
eukprot:g10280.t1